VIPGAAFAAWVGGRGDPLRRPSPEERRRIHGAVMDRDAWKCRAPWCQARARLTLHHVVPRAGGGDWSMGNLICLCAGCHGDVTERRVRVVRVVDASGERWEFVERDSRARCSRTR